MEDNGDHMKDDNFYPFDLNDDLNKLVGVEEFLRGVHERSNTNIGSSTFHKTYFVSSNGESNIDEEEGIEEILEPRGGLVDKTYKAYEHKNPNTSSILFIIL